METKFKCITSILILAVIITMTSCQRCQLDPYRGDEMPSDSNLVIVTKYFEVNNCHATVNGVQYKNPDSLIVSQSVSNSVIFVLRDNSLKTVISRLPGSDFIDVDSDYLRICPGGQYLEYRGSFYRIPDVGSPRLSTKIVRIQVVNGIIVDTESRT